MTGGILGFIAGILFVVAVWYVSEAEHNSPYRRGYRQGYFDACKDYHRIKHENDEDWEDDEV